MSDEGYCQCRSKHFMAGRCQGTIGHNGAHWFYRPDGWLARWPSRSEPMPGVAFSMTPPSHKMYISPKQKERHAYMMVYVRTHRKQLRDQQRRLARKFARRSPSTEKADG